MLPPTETATALATDGNDAVTIDIGTRWTGLGYTAADPGPPLPGNYALGQGDDTYNVVLTDKPVGYDIVIDDAGGAADTIAFKIGDANPATVGDDIDVARFAWLLDDETGDYDLLIALKASDREESDSFLILGQSTEGDGGIEVFDLGAYGVFTAAQVEAIFPQSPVPGDRVLTLDTGDLRNWDADTQTFDADGTPTLRFKLYDDGRQETTLYYEDGVRASMVTVDAENSHVWSTVSRVYEEDGQISEMVKIYDDGRIETTFFEDGVRASEVLEDPLNAVGWTRIDRTFDENGELEFQDRQFDDGSREIIRIDTQNEDEWERITERFDTDGDKVFEKVNFDDGRTANTYFDPKDEEIWDEYTDTFDATGQQILQVTVLDDAVVSSTVYEDGLPAFTDVIDTEDAKQWESRYIEYAPNGQVVLAETLHDNGRFQSAEYAEDGTIISVQNQDTKDIYDWTTTGRTFDENGVVVEKATIRDDGREDITSYEDGVRTQNVVTDVEDAYDWLTITRIYDDEGQEISKETVPDEEPDETDIAAELLVI